MARSIAGFLDSCLSRFFSFYNSSQQDLDSWTLPGEIVDLVAQDLVNARDFKTCLNLLSTSRSAYAGSARALWKEHVLRVENIDVEMLESDGYKERTCKEEFRRYCRILVLSAPAASVPRTLASERAVMEVARMILAQGGLSLTAVMFTYRDGDGPSTGTTIFLSAAQPQPAFLEDLAHTLKCIDAKDLRIQLPFEPNHAADYVVTAARFSPFVSPSRSAVRQVHLRMNDVLPEVAAATLRSWFGGALLLLASSCAPDSVPRDGEEPLKVVVAALDLDSLQTCLDCFVRAINVNPYLIAIRINLRLSYMTTRSTSVQELRDLLEPAAAPFYRARGLVGEKKPGGVHIWDHRNEERQLVYLNPNIMYMGAAGIDIQAAAMPMRVLRGESDRSDSDSGCGSGMCENSAYGKRTVNE